MKDETAEMKPRSWRRWVLGVIGFVVLTAIPTTCFYYDSLLPNRIPAMPLSTGWPVSISINVDAGFESLQATNQSLDDRPDAPEIILVATFSDGEVRELVGPAYRPLMVTNQLARDFRGHPCNESFACVVTGEVIPDREFRIVVYELEKALIGAKLRKLGDTFCRLNSDCGIEGVKIRFQTE